jgi:phospholipase C
MYLQQPYRSPAKCCFRRRNRNTQSNLGRVFLLVFAMLAARPANAATLSDVKHIVIILKENHTFDNYFGLFPGAEGATVGVHEDRLIRLARAPVIASGDLPHLRADALRVWANGMMDDFSYPSGYAQYAERQIPSYWAYARKYVLADNFFSSVMGPSFPNHLFTIFGTSFGSVDNPRHSDGSSSRRWGCDSAPDVLVLMVDGYHGRPCWDDPTLIDEMDAAGISWKYYGVTTPKDGYYWTQVTSIRHIRFGPDWSNVVPWQKFVNDAKSGALPAVSWVSTDGLNSEHPPNDVRVGQAVTAAMIAAVQNGPDAASTVIFVSWDDYGGWYDHVPPRQVDATGYGIRVPLIIVSPFAKRGYVFHGESDFASFPKFIEEVFGLAPMGPRDAGAGDLLGAFNFSP